MSEQKLEELRLRRNIRVATASMLKSVESIIKRVENINKIWTKCIIKVLC